MRAAVSVLVPVKNEVANIGACLESVAWADEVFVVDSQSTDGTVEEAERRGAQVLQFRFNGHYPKKKNWALANLPFRNEWVLILDADERIPPPLAAEMQETVQSGGRDGYYVNRRLWFLGGWIRHCGYYPSWNLRLFKHELGRYERMEAGGDTASGDNEVHEHVILNGEVGYLEHEMEHYAYPDIAAWVEKHNRYSSWEAHCAWRPAGKEGGMRAQPLGSPLQRRRWARRLASRLPFRPTLRFIYHYFLRGGFLDGYRGYVLSRLMGMYEFLSIAKLKELAAKDG
jgi:glycosyltransferase involved in cell wall biosynthesis